MVPWSDISTPVVHTSSSLVLVCLLDFEVLEGNVIVDQSGKGNNAYLDKGAVVRAHDQMCGHYADLTGNGDIILVDKTFRGKPQTGITIACWVNLRGNELAKHSLFSTVRMVSPVNFIGKLTHFAFLLANFILLRFCKPNMFVFKYYVMVGTYEDSKSN